jgi:hypothetical protein
MFLNMASAGVTDDEQGAGFYLQLVGHSAAAAVYIYSSMSRLPKPREIPILLRSAALLCSVRLALWIVPFPKLRRAVAWTVRTRVRPASRRTAEQLSWAVRAVSSYVPSATCLTQALALHILLRQEGLPSKIRIGVTRDAGHFEAHAWVESQERVVIGDSGLRRYAPILMWE